MRESFTERNNWTKKKGLRFCVVIRVRDQARKNYFNKVMKEFWLIFAFNHVELIHTISKNFLSLLYSCLLSVYSCVVFHLLICVELCDPMGCSMPGSSLLTLSWTLLKLMSIESVMSSNHLILCYPLLLLPLVFPSTGVFSNELALNQINILLVVFF